MTVTVETIDMGVRYTHANGRVLEIVGEADEGEWFAMEADGETCYAQGTYEAYDDEDGVFFGDDDGTEYFTSEAVVNEEDYAALAEEILTMGT